MKEEVWQYNTCPINTITASASNYFVYVKVKVGIRSSEYGISHDICVELMAPLLGQGIIFLQVTGILQFL